MIETNDQPVDSVSTKKESPKSPEKESLKTEKIAVGDKNPEELLEAMKNRGIFLDLRAEQAMKSPDFMPHTDKKLNVFQEIFKKAFGERENKPTTETVQIVRLKVKDLGFTNPPTTEKLFTKAEQLGLELCPAEIGPQYRLQYENQPTQEWVYIGMKPIDVSIGGPGLFLLKNTSVDGSTLDLAMAGSSITWNLDREFAFRIPSSKKSHGN